MAGSRQKMLPRVVFGPLALSFAFAVSAPLLGYHYLMLASEYRQRYVMQLNEIDIAHTLLMENPTPKAGAARFVASHVRAARSQAAACTENMSPLEAVVFDLLGADSVLDVWRNHVALADDALASLDKIHTSGLFSAALDGPTLAATQFEAREAVSTMRDSSLASLPTVSAFEQKLVMLLKLGTGFTACLLVGLFSLVTILTVPAWRMRDEQARTQEATHARMERQALTDALTGLPNRRHLDQALAAADPNTEIALIRLDLDRFKQVNDILGHAAGDFVLRHVAGILRNTVRPEDLPARVGGDEFVILCAPGTTQEIGRDIAQRLLDEVLKPLTYEGKRCVFGASFGVAATVPGETHTDELLQAADTALYRAKSKGRGMVEVYTSVMRRRAIQDRILADRFYEALQQGEIVPYYQTQHAASDWSLTGVEVLARWEHPTEGLLSPARFLGIARQLGMEADVDRVIFDSAVAAMDDLSERGHVVPRVSFNVSAGRIMDPAFLAIARERIPTQRSRFCFEILESISYEDSGMALDYAVDALKELGFQIDVDDFGSGHASINSVLKIEPHALKIDRNIVAPLGEHPRAEQTMGSILEFAKALGVAVIAEGVDSEAKALVLRRLGCDVLQGYFFSRPMPLPALIDRLMADTTSQQRRTAG